MPITTTAERLVPCILCGAVKFIPNWNCGDFAFVACAECGLLQRNPQPEMTAVDERYRATFAAEYLRYELANEASFLRLQQLGLADIGFPELEKHFMAGGDIPRCLDVGCAAGALLEWLRGRGWEAVGIELCESSAAYARLRGLDVRGEKLEAAGFAAASFDLIHASHLIEHLNDPRSFIRAVRRLLKPTGRLLLTTPNAAGFQARLFGARWRSAIFDHLYLFTKRQLIALLASEGFAVERAVTWGGLAAGTAPLAIKGIADAAAKRWGFGDVMMLRTKPTTTPNEADFDQSP